MSNHPSVGLFLAMDETGFLTSSAANVFLRGNDGDDALAVKGGSNVLDGEKSSNFLVGAVGDDGGTHTFFLDGRGMATTWDTLVNFHPATP